MQWIMLGLEEKRMSRSKGVFGWMSVEFSVLIERNMPLVDLLFFPSVVFTDWERGRRIEKKIVAQNQTEWYWLECGGNQFLRKENRLYDRDKTRLGLHAEQEQEKPHV